MHSAVAGPDCDRVRTELFSAGFRCLVEQALSIKTNT